MRCDAMSLNFSLTVDDGRKFQNNEALGTPKYKKDINKITCKNEVELERISLARLVTFSSIKYILP